MHHHTNTHIAPTPCTMLGCRELATTTDVDTGHPSCPKHSGRTLCDMCAESVGPWGREIGELATHVADDGCHMCDMCADIERDNGHDPSPIN